ncbi:MAG TPA: DUF2303 family protein [Accumulibacter sp.]|nr:DUF2303 family protein [Accumulibacter sp.]
MIRPDADQTTTTEEIMKPIHDNLKAVRIEDDETGDLLPLLDYAGQKFSNLVKAVVDTNNGGTITIKVTVRPSTAGALAVKPEVRVTLPKASAYQIDARLKYRESSGKVSFWFELIRPDKAFRQAVEDELGAIAGATGLSIINGKK